MAKDLLTEAEMDARLKDLIQQLAARESDVLTDAEIDREVQAVRGASRPA